MATVIERPRTTARDERHLENEKQLEEFLSELGNLSRRFNLAIGDGAVLYVMEPEDGLRTYTADEGSALTFG